MNQPTASRQLATRIRIRRGQIGWSAQQLADACAEAGASSLTRTTIAKIESGSRQTVTAGEIASLARALRMSPTELLAPESDAEALFGALLDLSRHAGGPPVRELARKAGLPGHVLSDVFRGRTIPTWPTLEPVVHALGGDPERFRELCRRAAEGDAPRLLSELTTEQGAYPWAGELEGINDPGTLANPRRDPFALTLLFLEVGLKTADEDLGRLSNPAPGWRRITRDGVVRAATRLADERGAELGLGATRPTTGAFRERWARTADYLQDLVTYALHSTRWRDALELARMELLAGLDDVAAGRARFSDLILAVAEKDMAVRLRFARYVIFQLSMAVDDDHRRLAQKAHAQFFEAYSVSWVVAYREALDKLGLALRPGAGVEVLAKLFSCLANGIVTVATDLDDDEFTKDPDGRPLLAEGVMLMILGSIDPGDGRSSREVIDTFIG